MNLMLLMAAMALPPQAPVPLQAPPVAATPVSYQEAERLVLSGQPVTLFIGVPATEVTSTTVVVAYVEALPGSTAGVYDCFRVGKQAMFRPRPVLSVVYQWTAPLRSTCPNGKCPYQK